MKMNIFKSMFKAIGVAICIPACVAMSSCSAEPDDSDLYTFTGQTVEDFLVANDSVFSSFNYILTRCGYDRIMSSYGTYTCFAPTNDAVGEYIDSLYNDVESENHNGMLSNSLEGLTDSLCEDIAKYHIAGSVYKEIDMSASGISITSLLGRPITTSVVNGKNVLNDLAEIINADNEVVNGVVHVIDNVIPRSNRFIASELGKALDKNGQPKFSIFAEALEATGLSLMMEADKKLKTFTMPEKAADYYTPTECKVGFTIFAESDATFAKHGIHSFEDLVRYANEQYAHSADNVQESENAGWYDWYRNEGIEVSTGNDYTSPSNALNMFVRYHIFNYAVAKHVLTLDHSVWNGNGYNGDVWDYYETQLPKTLMKVWKIKKTNKTYINRAIANNTLTDGIETMGSDAMHQMITPGVEIDMDSVLSPRNGYIYPLNDILVYNYNVPNAVLNERMRFDALNLLGEVMSNGFRGLHANELTALNGGIGASRVRFPVDYLDNVKVYNGNLTKIDMNVLANVGSGNSFLLYRGDSFQGMGTYDLAIKLPPVPDGFYELRVAATNFGDRGSMLQFYIGESSDVTSMEAIDIPIDLRMGTAPLSDARLAATGYCDINDEENYPDAFADRGVETDKTMRNNSYMREGLSIVKEENKVSEWVGRFKAYSLRRILIKRDFKQRDYWLRIKTVLPEVTTGKYQLDYVELVPTKVFDNPQYMEDMY